MLAKSPGKKESAGKGEREGSGGKEGGGAGEWGGSGRTPTLSANLSDAAARDAKMREDAQVVISPQVYLSREVKIGEGGFKYRKLRISTPRETGKT